MITYILIGAIVILVITSPLAWMFRERILKHVPYTQTRAEAKLISGLSGLISDHDVLIGYETADGMYDLAPADYDAEAGLYETTAGRWVLPRGDGQLSTQLMGSFPFIYAHEVMPAAISSEASVMGAAAEDGEIEIISPDGGEAAGLKEVAELDIQRDIPLDDQNNLRVAHQGSLLGAAKLAPFPVDERDTRTAAEWMALSHDGERSALWYVLMGAGGLLVAEFLFAIILSVVGGGGGGSVGGIIMMGGI